MSTEVFFEEEHDVERDVKILRCRTVLQDQTSAIRVDSHRLTEQQHINTRSQCPIRYAIAVPVTIQADEDDIWLVC
ncbi:hypothetical protein PHSY_006906 [Pseudozyma hubeiensis SY62]|uniref:Uncharacterized protein n=1 Tax=Pseudozyma hubeiensis (strain SY62) TaxID=1305764 RepID=R9PMI1_PSEHS|nr:hypothetical protein PHSY_006906 [Pseudozyma hubeiensis SY62]GAC99305.1 hypothetical protein PHSY_006906 [Pseudozyma hubeiensis SY62]